jgi:hypothetical protein
VVNASSSNFVGGFIGLASGDNFNLIRVVGMKNSPSSNLVIGNNNVGGVIGSTSGRSTITKSGISYGKISGVSSVGGVIVIFYFLFIK